LSFSALCSAAVAESAEAEWSQAPIRDLCEFHPAVFRFRVERCQADSANYFVHIGWGNCIPNDVSSRGVHNLPSVKRRKQRSWR
jgi:hypothetical protein